MLGKSALRGALVLTVSALVVACSSSGHSGGASSPGPSAGKAGLSGTLRIFAYSDAFAPAVFDAFVKANPNLNIQRAEISSDLEAVAKLKAGFQADVVNSCAGPVDQERANGDLQPIDTSRITDWNQIYPFFKNIKGVQVNGKVYMLPLVGGAYGLVYRPSAFPKPPTSWMTLFTTTKRISEPDDPLTNIIAAALALGYFPPQNMTAAQLANVKRLLEKQKQHVITYYSGNAITTLWKQGEVDITPTDITLVDQLNGQNAAFAPMNPPLAWTCGYSIGAKAHNLKAVYAFLNYALSPLVQTVQAKKFSYLVSNRRSAAQLPASVLAKTGQNNIQKYSKAATFGTPTNIAAWTALWQSIKS
jgi:spermidine/putrescine transport system substrate-binding protein